jgi:C6 transcription factor Pro1
LELSAFVGYKTWALVVIAEIAALNAWKKENTSSLAQSELLWRAGTILQSIQKGIDNEQNHHSQADGSQENNDFKVLAAHYHAGSSPDGRQATTSFVTRTWAHAARIYLFTVTWQNEMPHRELQQDLQQILNLLQDVRSIAILRTFAWPICVAGCLATSTEQQQHFEKIVDGAGDQQLMGGLREVSQIMKAVWERQCGREPVTPDSTSCLTILGWPALLA